MKTFLLILTVIVACSSEPHCSKFHYEENLLEKMIRTEILVENTKKQIDDIETRVTGSLAKLKEDTTTWEGKIEIIQANLITLQENSKSNLITLQEKAKSGLITLQEKAKSGLITLQEKAKSELNKHMQAVQDLKDKVVSPNIAFRAKNMKNDHPAYGDTIVFTEIVLNLGESYNNDTGVFTVPLGGIYLFTVQLCFQNNKFIDYGLVVNDVYMDVTRNWDNSGAYNCKKSTTTVLVKSGNKVWVTVISGSGSRQSLFHSDTNFWTSFSGVLIHTV